MNFPGQQGKILYKFQIGNRGVKFLCRNYYVPSLTYHTFSPILIVQICTIVMSGFVHALPLVIIAAVAAGHYDSPKFWNRPPIAEWKGNLAAETKWYPEDAVEDTLHEPSLVEEVWHSEKPVEEIENEVQAGMDRSGINYTNRV